jgi:hypothetical protein
MTTNVRYGASGQLFALRLRGTDDMFMPARRSGRGFSHDEPQRRGGELGPRLFPTPLHAERAARAWNKGKFRRKVRYTMDDCSEEIVVEPVEARRGQELEVVGAVVCVGEHYYD